MTWDFIHFFSSKLIIIKSHVLIAITISITAKWSYEQLFRVAQNPVYLSSYQFQILCQNIRLTAMEP